MKNPVQNPNHILSSNDLESLFRRFLLQLGYSSISCKLYVSDLSRFIRHIAPDTPLTLQLLSRPTVYTSYLSLPEISGSLTLLRRSLASLKQFGVFIATTYNLPNPTQSLTIRSKATPNSNSELINKYIKTYIEYLKTTQVGNQSMKSYKSDVTQYLTYLLTNNSSSLSSTLLDEKNIEIYAAEMRHSQGQSPNTILRKIKTIRRFVSYITSNHATVVVSDNHYIPANPNNLPHESLPTHSLPHTTQLAHPLPQAVTHPSPDISIHSVKKTNYRISNIITAILLLGFTSALGILGYRQFSTEAKLTAAYPSTPVTPNRQLSFQGRLENASGTPITSATNFVFKLYDNVSGGSQLYTSGTCSITPDTDGVFSTQIGSTCGSGITSSVFTENSNVYLEVTVGAETLTPRQQIATVAYALNSETLQGFPLSATVSAIKNTVVPMNQWGEIIVGEQSPRLKGVSGTFQISAPALSFITTSGSNGNISFAPDGTGQINATGNTTTTNFFNVSNSQLTTGSLITGTAANNNSGFKLLNLLSGSSPTSKYSIDDAGNSIQAGTLTLPNTNTATGVANYLQLSQGLSVGGGTTYYINSSGNANLNTTTLASTLDANGQADIGDGGDTITLNGSSITLTGFNCSANTNGGTLTTNGSGVLQCSDDDSGSGGSSRWQENLGTISPINSTWDVLVGGTATSSAKIGFININSGTPTINLANQASNIAVKDATANALQILEGANAYLALTTSNGSEALSFGNTTTNPSYSFLGSGTTTFSGSATINTTLTANGTVALGDGGDTITIDSNDWDITSAGNISGIGTISSDGDWTNSQATPTISLTDTTASADDYTINVDGNIFDVTNSTDSRVELQFTGAGGIVLGDNTATKTIAIGGNTSSAADTISIATNATAADIITIGNAHASTTLALTGGTAWSVGTTGNATFANLTSTGNTQLGNANTDTIDFQGRVLQDADLLPIGTTGTNDLGSASLPWDNIYVGVVTQNGNLVCDSSGANCPAGSNLWRSSLGALSPITDTYDLLVGGIATSSAKIGFININSGTPTINLANQASNIAVKDATANALQILEGANAYLALTTSNGSEALSFGNTTTNPSYSFLGSGTTTHGGAITLPNSNTLTGVASYLQLSNGLSVGGGTTYYFNSSGNLNGNTGTFASTLTANGIFVLGDGGDAGSVNTSDWDISTSGDLTGIGAITADGLLTLSNSATMSGTLTIGNGTTNNIRPAYGPLTLSYKSAADTWTTGITLQDTTGNVGIGVTAPSQKLEVNGYIAAQRFVDSSTTTNYLDPADPATSLAISGDILNTDTNTFSISSTSNNNIVINAGSGTVEIGSGGAGKLDAGTIDPPYTINGKKFATYMASMTGVKEETTGSLTTTEYIPTRGYRATIDLAHSPEGSDIWLFSKTTDLKNNLANLVVLISSNQNAKTWYALDSVAGKLYLYSTVPATLSYRLTAPRFDAELWNNARDSGSDGHILTDTSDWDTSVVINHAVTPVDLEHATNLLAQPSPSQRYDFVAEVKDLVENLALIKDAVIANLTVGTLSSESLSTNFITPLASDSSITITAPLIITPPANNPDPNEPLILVEGEIEAATVSARTAILTNLSTEDATVSGTLYANHIDSPTLTQLENKLATLSATPSFSDTDLSNLTNRIRDRITELFSSDVNASILPTPPEATVAAPLETFSDITPDLATFSADLDFVTINQYLAVIGKATITTLAVNDAIYTNRIESYDGVIKLAQNTLIIDALGQVSINGNLDISGSLTADQASFNTLSLGPTPSSSPSALGQLLAIYNESGRPVATIDASGAANLARVTTQLITIASNNSTSSNSGELSSHTSSNSTAGTSVLTSPNTEQTITSPYVTANSLIYLTPTTNTDNKVLFVKAKNTCETQSSICTPSFTVGVDAAATSDISFNWWIIQLATTTDEVLPSSNSSSP